jgi:predicted nucleic acid-binding protein
MRVVVADTGPLNYLVLINAIDLLPRLFETVLIPEAVRSELLSPRAALPVRAWAENCPPWVDVHRIIPTALNEPALSALDKGEVEALSLALSVGADLIVIDDRAGAAVASKYGFDVTGTLGVLVLAARHNLVDLAAAFDRLKATSFYYRQSLLDALLAEHSKRKI